MQAKTITDCMTESFAAVFSQRSDVSADASADKKRKNSSGFFLSFSGGECGASVPSFTLESILELRAFPAFPAL